MTTVTIFVNFYFLGYVHNVGANDHSPLRRERQDTCNELKMQTIVNVMVMNRMSGYLQIEGAKDFSPLRGKCIDIFDNTGCSEYTNTGTNVHSPLHNIGG